MTKRQDELDAVIKKINDVRGKTSGPANPANAMGLIDELAVAVLDMVRIFVKEAETK